MNGRRVGWMLAVLAYASWGLLSPVGKLLVDDFGVPPNTLNAMRLGVATALLMLAVGPRRGALAFHILRRDGNVAVLGVVGIGLTFTFFLYALQVIEATVATLLVFMSPLLVVPLAARFLGEPASRATWAAAVLVLAGAWLTLFGLGAPDLGRREWAGLGVSMLSVLSWTVYTVHLRLVAPRHDPYALTVGSFLAATVLFTLLAVATEDFGAGARLLLEPRVLGWFAAYVILPSVLAYVLYTAALQRLEAGPVSVLLGLELIVTAFVARWLNGETFPALKVAGLVVVGLTITLFLVHENRRVHVGPSRERR